MRLEGTKVLLSGRSRSTYRKVNEAVSARLSEAGDEILIETSIPVSSGFSDVCVVLPVAALPELVRLGLRAGSEAEALPRKAA